MPYRTPLMLTSIISSQSSTRRSSKGDTGMTPALLKNTSSLPYRSQASLTRSETSSRRFTSVGAYSTLPPAATMRSASDFRRPEPRAPSTSFAPRSASKSAVASPIPLLAPVIATTLSLILDMMESFPVVSIGGRLKDLQRVSDSCEKDRSIVLGVECSSIRKICEIVRGMLAFGAPSQARALLHGRLRASQQHPGFRL